MIGKFLGFVLEEEAWFVLARKTKESQPLVEQLEASGLLDLYLKVAAGGGSIWGSAVPDEFKPVARDLIASQSVVKLFESSPDRFMKVLFDALPPTIRAKLEAAAPSPYWLREVGELLAGGGNA